MEQYNFLIVDDIYMNRLLLKKLLQNNSNKSFEAENGAEAIEILKTEDIDVVLMDIEMPVMNGVETTKFIRTKFNSPLNKIPIIAFTAHNPNDFFSDYKNIGFNEILTKPYSLRNILRVMEKIKS